MMFFFFNSVGRLVGGFLLMVFLGGTSGSQ